MSVLLLILIWAIAGIFIGVSGLAARLTPSIWGMAGWRWLLVLTTGAALAGGWTGYWLFGRLFSVPMALWVAVLAVCGPWFYLRLRMHLVRPQR